MLRAGRVVPFAEMLCRLEVSPATLKRDLQCLRDELGAPIKYEHHEGGYRLTEAWAGVAAAIFAEVSP